MESELLNAAQEGSVETLTKLLRQDKLILLRFISECPKETPLHIAAMCGHLEFTKEILIHMPDMAKELDSKKSTPLHVATACGHIQIVKQLLSVNAEMCFAQDWEGKNPVHIAVIKGHTDILKELVELKPQAAQALLGASTILHLCVKYYQTDALVYILRMINDAKPVNSKDKEGFTILHLAVLEKQAEVVKFLLHNCQVEVNATNKYGLTAWDISLAQGRRNIKDIEIAECLQQARESAAQSTTKSRIRKNETGLINKVKKFCLSANSETKNEKKKRLEDSSNALMIVASLIAAMAFQALTQPPDIIKEFQASTQPPDKIEAFQAPAQPPHYNTEDDTSFKISLFYFFTTWSFATAMFVILLLIGGLPVQHRPFMWILRIAMWIAILASSFTYYFVADLILNKNVIEAPFDSSVLMVGSMFGLIVILTLGNAIRILYKMVRCFCGCMKEKRGRTNSSAQDRQSCV